MKLKRIFALALTAALLFSFFACAGGENPPVTPPEEGGGGDEGGGESVAQTVRITGPAYASVGEIVRFSLAGENCDVTTATVTLSDPDAATPPTVNGERCSMRMLKEGAVTLTVRCGEAEASCDLTVLPENGVYTNESTLIRYLGRTVAQNNAQVFRNTASGYEVTFYGKKLTAKMANVSGTTMMAVLLDGETDPEAKKIDLTSSSNGEFVLANFEKAGVHTVRVQKVTEESISVGSLVSLSVEGGGLVTTEAPTGIKIVAYGDSITCGYGNMRPDAAVDGLSADTQNGLMTYAAIAARELGAEYEAFSRSGIGLYTNPHNLSYNMLDVYDYLSPMSNGSQRWDMAANKPDVVIINLGTNDAGATENKANSIPAGMPFYSDAGMRDAYVEFVEKLDEAYGEGVMYFLVGGMMTKATNTAMQEAVATLTAAGINARTVDLPARTGYGGHPTVDVHQAAATVLYDAIIEAYTEK